MRRVASASSDWPGPRAVLRCPGCGATVSLHVRGGAVLAIDLAHEEACPWLAAVERGIPVTPVQVEILLEGRP